MDGEVCVCYGEEDFIEYLNTYIFPDQPSIFVKNLGFKIPKQYQHLPYFNFQEATMDLKEMQKIIYQNKIDKGFNVTDLNIEFCLLYGEVSEAYEAWRKKNDTVGEELADVAIYLLGMSEILGIDLQTEIEKKMKINQKRQYQVIDGVVSRIEK